MPNFGDFQHIAQRFHVTICAELKKQWLGNHKLLFAKDCKIIKDIILHQWVSSSLVLVMKAAMKTEPKPGIAIQELDIPALKEGEILVKVKAAAICGSDMHLYFWDEQTAKWKSPLPMVIGHEFSGEVTEVGKNVHSLSIGDRIAAESHIPCQNCYLCRTGRMHICENMRIYGIQTKEGAFAEYAVLPHVIAYKLPDTVSYEDGALFEPFGVATHAIERAQIRLGDSVAILGAGPIGLFCLQLAKLLGATPLIVSEMRETRLRMAENLHVADAIIDSAHEDVRERVMELTSGRGVDVVVEAAGASQTVQQAFEILGKNGKIVLMGLPTKSTEIDTTSKITYKEADVLGTTGRLMFETWDRMSRIVGHGRVNLGSVVTHKLPLKKVEEGFKAIIDGKAGKVLLIP